MNKSSYKTTKLQKHKNMHKKTSGYGLWIGVFYIVPVIFIIIGAGLIIGNSDEKKLCTETTTGYCIDMDTHWHDGEMTYQGIYEYKVDGSTYTMKSIHSYESRYGVREEIRVKYNPDNPSQTYQSSVTYSGWIFVIFGFTFIGLVIKSVHGNRKNRTKKYDI